MDSKKTTQTTPVSAHCWGTKRDSKGNGSKGNGSLKCLSECRALFIYLSSYKNKFIKEVVGELQRCQNEHLILDRSVQPKQLLTQSSIHLCTCCATAQKLCFRKSFFRNTTTGNIDNFKVLKLSSWQI